MRIAAANIHSAWGRPDEGAERAVEWIGKAGAEGVDLRSDIFQLSVDRRRLSVADLSDDPVSLD